MGESNGKVAIVTGAGGGIGQATALRLAEDGAQVAIFELNAENGQATAQQCEAAGGKALAVEVDMSLGAAVEAAVGQVVTNWGRLDIMVNIVGGSGRRWGDGPVADCTEEGWDRTLALNLKTVFLGCKYAIPAMHNSGGGSIVTLSSVLGLVGGDEDFATHAYAASKGGIISLTRAIASYYATKQIRANVVCPSLIATSMSQRAQTSPTIRAKLPQLQPLTGEFGQPDDVAQAIRYLASDRAAFVTGSVLTVDGGWTMR
jgi:NAD(P)-dependent dehydrogenase (short-subunit alcohol dehydrogenase family)